MRLVRASQAELNEGQGNFYECRSGDEEETGGIGLDEACRTSFSNQDRTLAGWPSGQRHSINCQQSQSSITTGQRTYIPFDSIRNLRSPSNHGVQLAGSARDSARGGNFRQILRRKAWEPRSSLHARVSWTVHTHIVAIEFASSTGLRWFMVYSQRSSWLAIQGGTVVVDGRGRIEAQLRSRRKASIVRGSLIPPSHSDFERLHMHVRYWLSSRLAMAE